MPAKLPLYISFRARFAHFAEFIDAGRVSPAISRSRRRRYLRRRRRPREAVLVARRPRHCRHGILRHFFASSAEGEAIISLRHALMMMIPRCYYGQS